MEDKNVFPGYNSGEEERFRQYLKHAPYGIIIINEQGQIIEINKSACMMGGYSEKEYLKREIFEFIHDKSKEDALKNFEELLRTGKSQGEFYCKKKDGSFFICKLKAARFNNKFIGFIDDITDKKNAETELKKAKELSEKYLNLAGTILISMNKKGEIIMLNKKGYEVLGYNEGELIGKNWFDICLPKEIVSEVKEVFYKAIEGKFRIESYENEVLRKDNKKRLVRWYNTTLKNEDGEIIALLSSGEDITEKKEIEERLKESGEKYQELFEKAPNFTTLIDEDFKIISINRAIKGLNKNKVFGKKMHEVVSPEHHKDMENAIRNVFNTGKNESYQSSMIGPDGKLVWHENYIGLLKRRDGKNPALIVSVDITPQKEFEEKLKAQTLELKNSKEFLQDVIDSASDMIFSITDKGKVTSWNPSSKFITGYKYWEAVGRHILSLKIFGSEKEIKELLIKKPQNEKIEAIIKTPSGKPRTINFSVSRLKAGTELEGYVFIGTDVTSKIPSKARFGNSYLLRNSKTPYKIFLNQISPEKRGIFISRTLPSVIQESRQKNYLETILLREDIYRGLRNINFLFNEMAKICEYKNCILFLDRIDYLINLYGFNEFMKFIYALNDHIKEKNHMLMVNLNTKILSEKELALLEQEILPFPETLGIFEEISPELVEILELILSNKKRSISTSFKQIRNHFKISNVTTRKRVNELVEKEYLEISREGRLKHPILTSKALVFLEDSE